jgi:hypothetical protein
VDKELIDRIYNEVQKIIMEMNTRPAAEKSTLVIADANVPARDKAAEFLNSRFSDLKYAVLPGEGSAEGIATDEKELLSDALKSENIVLLAPRVWLLENIAMGRDEGPVEHIIMRSVLWGIRVHVLLDFERPKFKRGTFFEKINDILHVLAEMGVVILSYVCVQPEKEAHTLVTEQEVLDAYARGEDRILCARGVIVTPAAKDRAKELKIKIDG